VMWFYDIVSEICPDESGVKLGSPTTTDTSGWFNTILKRTGIVVGILWGIFLLIVIFFAIKARLQQNNDEEAQQ
jgi:heme/copper-type cytochrome/quinol oxidase subunit 2